MAVTVADPADVVAVITHPKVWPHVSDDWTPKPAEWSAPPGISLAMHDAEGVAGIATFVPLSMTLWHGHFAFLPGRSNVFLAKEAFRWMEENTPITCALGFTPASNTKAVGFIEKCGASRVGTTGGAHAHNGSLESLVVNQVCFKQKQG